MEQQGARPLQGGSCEEKLLVSIKVEQPDEEPESYTEPLMLPPGQPGSMTEWDPLSDVKPKMEYLPPACETMDLYEGVEMKPNAVFLPYLTTAKPEVKFSQLERPSAVFLPPELSIPGLDLIAETEDLKLEIKTEDIKSEVDSSLSCPETEMDVAGDGNISDDVEQVPVCDMMKESEIKMDFEETWNDEPASELFPDVTNILLALDLNSTTKRGKNTRSKPKAPPVAASSTSCDLLQQDVGSDQQQDSREKAKTNLQTRSKKRKSIISTETEPSKVKQNKKSEVCGVESITTFESDSGEHCYCNFEKENYQKSELYICHLCAITFKDPKSFNNHIVNSHNKYLYCDKYKFLMKVSNKKISKKHESQCCKLSRTNSFSHLCYPEKDLQSCSSEFDTDSDKEIEESIESENDGEIFEKSKYLICHLCSITFTNSDLYNEHISKNHERHVYCHKCKFLLQFRNKGILERHESQCCKLELKKETVIKCNYCTKCFKNITKMNNHVQTKHPNESNPSRSIHTLVKCNHCSGNFNNDIELKNHVLLTHRQKEKTLTNVPTSSVIETSFKCKICPMSFTEVIGFNKHFAVEHPNSIKSLLIGQNAVDSTIIPSKPCMPCILCSMSFENPETLNSHVALCHPAKISPAKDLEISPAPSPSVKMLIKCNNCPSFCYSLISLKKHIALKHTNKLNTPDVATLKQQNTSKSISLIKCSYCKILVNNLESMSNHVAKMHPEKLQSSTASWSNPSNISISNLTLVKCNYCTLFAKSSIAMTKHLAKMHPDKLPANEGARIIPTNSETSSVKTMFIKCKYCTAMAKNEAAMDNHVFMEHPKKAKNLGSDVKIVSNLTGTSSVNTAFIKCNFCELYLKNLEEINEHVTNNHNVQSKSVTNSSIIKNDMLIKCNSCDMHVKNMTELSKHIAIMHSEKCKTHICKKVLDKNCLRCNPKPISKCDTSTQYCEDDLGLSMIESIELVLQNRREIMLSIKTEKALDNVRKSMNSIKESAPQFKNLSPVVHCLSCKKDLPIAEFVEEHLLQCCYALKCFCPFCSEDMAVFKDKQLQYLKHFKTHTCNQLKLMKCKKCSLLIFGTHNLTLHTGSKHSTVPSSIDPTKNVKKADKKSTRDKCV